MRNPLPTNTWAVTIRNGNKTTSLDHLPIAYGTIVPITVFPDSSQRVRGVTLLGTNAPNEAASGTAQLIIVQGTVNITLSGLQPYSSHAAFVHQGRCDAQGPVQAVLHPVVADKRGKGTSLTFLGPSTVQQLSSTLFSSSPRWYITVLLGVTQAELSQSVFLNPIACGPSSR